MAEMRATMTNFTSKMERVASGIEILTLQNDKVVRYLLIVVCVIALGQAGTQILQGFGQKLATIAEAQGK